MSNHMAPCLQTRYSSYGMFVCRASALQADGVAVKAMPILSLLEILSVFMAAGPITSCFEGLINFE